MAMPTALSSVEHSGNGIKSTFLIMLVDSDASGYYLDSELAPGIQFRVTNYAELKQPQRIDTAGKHTVEGVATGTISRIVTGRDGKRHPVSPSVTIMPGLGRYLFFVASTSNMGAVAVFYSV